MNIRIEFDGGTSCNVPRLGFGNGYGSYKINDEPVHRCNFNLPMSANAAELRTLWYAVKALIDRGIDAKHSNLFIVGDSQIALGWAGNPKRKMSKKATPEFRESIALLQEVVSHFGRVYTEWQPRERSVKTFGH